METDKPLTPLGYAATLGISTGLGVVVTARISHSLRPTIAVLIGLVAATVSVTTFLLTYPVVKAIIRLIEKEPPS